MDMPAANRWKLVDLVMMAALVVTIVAFGFVIWQRIKMPAVPAASFEPIAPEQPTIPRPSSLLVGPPTILLEISDYQCPFCGAHAREIAPRVRREFIDTGKIRHLFINLPLERIHPNAFRAAEAAECAGRQNRYWQMHEKLFADQAHLSESDLKAHAAVIGLDNVAFSECMQGEVTAKILQDVALSRKLQVRSTPTFFIGIEQPDGSIKLVERMSGAGSYSAFATALGAALLSTDSKTRFEVSRFR